MSKQNQANETQQDKKNRPKLQPPALTPDLTGEKAGLPPLPDSLLVAGANSIEAQAGRLGDTRLQTAQRQEMAAHIGQKQGNQHLQRVVVAFKAKPPAPSAKSSADSNGGPALKKSAASPRPSLARPADPAEPITEEVLGESFGGSGAPSMAAAEPPPNNNQKPTLNLSQRLQAAAGGGAPLEAGVQRRLEAGLEADLSQVWVHTDREADEMAQSVNAVAFTTGQDIFFREGTYNPNSTDGLKLLAHEATHTVQQAAGPVSGEPGPDGLSISNPDDRFEQAAEHTADAIVMRTAVPDETEPTQGQTNLSQRSAFETKVEDASQGSLDLILQNLPVIQQTAEAQASKMESLVKLLQDARQITIDTAMPLPKAATSPEQLLQPMQRQIADPSSPVVVQRFLPIVPILIGAGVVGGIVEAIRRESRSLNETEINYAKDVFHDSLDYSVITITRGSLMSTGAPRTIGNTIHFTDNYYVGDTMELTEAGKLTLVHEMAHVWQYQHDGWTYAPAALWAQAKAWWHTGSRNAAYDWRSLHNAGTPWADWNPEAQAEAVEDYNKALRKGLEGTATAADYETLSMLQPYIADMQAGPPPAPEGAQEGEANPNDGGGGAEGSGPGYAPPAQRQIDPVQRQMEEIGRVSTQWRAMTEAGQIQRAPEPDPAANVNKEEALIKAVNLVNKNSLLKIKLPVKAPTGHKIFGGLELKKFEVELDVVGEASLPSLSDKKSTTKVAGGVQNVGQSETDPAKRSATEAQGTVWSLELEQKFGSSPFSEMFSFKPGVEYGSYTPANALVPNKQEFKGKLGFQIAVEGFSLEVQFIPVAYDKTKTGADAWKFGTFAGKIAKEFSLKAPGLLNMGGTGIDVTLKAKATGTVEIGPDYSEAYQTLAKYMGQEAEEKVAKEIAKEETEITLKQLVKEIVEDETKEIADKTARKTAQ